MKTRILSIVFVFAFVFLAAGFNKAGAMVKVDKILTEKTFEINKDALLLIDHEYGNVNIQNWEKNSILIKVTVHIETDNEEQAKKIIDRIQLNVTGDKTKVSSVCSLNSSSNSKTSFSIDVEVFMPKTASLQLKHKFGAAYIESVEGTAKIKSEYGSVKILSLLNPDSRLDVSFGSAEVDKMGNGSFEINYSSLELKIADDVNIESKYSELELGNLRNATITVEGGSLEIGNIVSFQGSTKFSNVDIGNLSESLRSTIEYGNMDIEFVKAGFSSIDIENKFSTVNLGIDKTAGYSVKVQTSFGDFSYPESLTNFSNKITSATGSSYTGSIGKSQENGSKLIVNSSYGGINVRAR